MKNELHMELRLFARSILNLDVSFGHMEKNEEVVNAKRVIARTKEYKIRRVPENLISNLSAVANQAVIERFPLICGECDTVIDGNVDLFAEGKRCEFMGYSVEDISASIFNNNANVGAIEDKIIKARILGTIYETVANYYPREKHKE